MKHTQAQIDVKSVVIHNTLMVLDVQLVGNNPQIVINMVISVACATKRKKNLTKKRSLESRSPKEHQLKIGPVYTQDSICSQSEKGSRRFILLAIEVAIYTS